MESNQTQTPELNQNPELTVIQQAIDAAVTRGVYNRAEVVLLDQCLKGIDRKMTEQAERIAELENIASLVTADNKEPYEKVKK